MFFRGREKKKMKKKKKLAKHYMITSIKQYLKFRQ